MSRRSLLRVMRWPRWDFDKVGEHEQVLASRLAEGLAEIDGVQLLRLWSDAPRQRRHRHLHHRRLRARQIAAYLSAEHGIGVRDGRSDPTRCSTAIGHAGGAVRASLGLGTGSDDVERLIAAVRRLVAGEQTWNYARPTACGTRFRRRVASPAAPTCRRVRLTVSESV
ncbi:aminotransferase class V-fold PLP-dependent enzyme [Rhodococcus hoagii]|nr:aminotransferase class V-fold PLP-dependent enzyme [Prescottella equi]